MGWALGIGGFIKKATRAKEAEAVSHSQPSYNDIDRWEEAAAPELAARKQAGEEVLDYLVYDSLLEGLPYACCRDWEFEMVKRTVTQKDECNRVKEMWICLMNYVHPDSLND